MLDHNQTTIELPVKQYVKVFLEKECGNPVNLRNWDQSVHYSFLQHLIKKNFHNDLMHIAGYGHTIDLVVTIDDLERFGKGLSKTQICRINSFFEFLIKDRARIYNYVLSRNGYTKKDTVELFMKDHRFDEDIFQSNTIIRDLDRKKLKRPEKM